MQSVKQHLVQEICPSTTMGRIKDGVLLVDVREMEEVKELAFDVPNILNIPLSNFEKHFHEIPKDKDIVLVCSGGMRSVRAAAYLLENGFSEEKVFSMKFGLQRWVQKNFPTIGHTGDMKTESGCCGGCGHSHDHDD